MAKAKKEKEENETSEVSAAENESEISGSTVREIPVGDGEADESAEPVVEEEIDQVQQLQAQIAELEDQKLRVLADMDNHRKRMARQFEMVARVANDRLLGELLDVIDNLERALDHANGDTDEDKARKGLQEGAALIHQQMLDLLSRYEVRPIEAVGHQFDAAYHEALMQVASDEYDEGIVVSEIRKGYMIGDRVLRHARVAVSQPQTDDDSAAREE